MTDPLKSTRARNRAMVREQRRALGVDREEESPHDLGKLTGIARMMLLASEVPTDPEDRTRLTERRMRELRRDVQSVPGRNLDRDERVRLHNGDIELRAWWSQRMTRKDAEQMLAQQAALRVETH